MACTFAVTNIVEWTNRILVVVPWCYGFLTQVYLRHLLSETTFSYGFMQLVGVVSGPPALRLQMLWNRDRGYKSKFLRSLFWLKYCDCWSTALSGRNREQQSASPFQSRNPPPTFHTSRHNIPISQINSQYFTSNFISFSVPASSVGE